MKYIVLLTLLLSSVIANASFKETNFKFRNVYKSTLYEISDTDLRIIGGNVAEPNSIPYQAFLELGTMSQLWHCGGTLISQNYVMTAGHCGFGALKARVVLGAHKPLQEEDTQIAFFCTEITVHPEYNADLIIYDISVIKLPAAVTYNDFIQPSTLPSWSDASNFYENVSARVSGWGYTDTEEPMLSDVLKYADVLIVRNRECEALIGPILPSILCTWKTNDLACNGDSGGPLVVDGVQVGIVSFGIMGCPTGGLNGYTRITRFLDWIEANTDVKIAE